MHRPASKHISLRGASAKEATRNALLEKVAEERSVRSAARRISAAVILIQRIWRGRRAAKLAAEMWRSVWDARLQKLNFMPSAKDISDDILRPFLFFMRSYLQLTCRQPLQAEDARRITICLELVLRSIKSSDHGKNFCGPEIISGENGKRWIHQVHELIKICLVLLRMDDMNGDLGKSLGLLKGLGVCLLIALTDTNLWKHAEDKELSEDVVLRLLQWMTEENTGLYPSARAFLLATYPICKDGDKIVKNPNVADNFLTTASVITMVLRPFHMLTSKLTNLESSGQAKLNLSLQQAAKQFCTHILTISFLVQRIPASLTPALQHQSSLVPCFQGFQYLEDFFREDCSRCLLDGNIPLAAWAFANVVELASWTTPSPSNRTIRLPENFKYKEYADALCCLIYGIMPWIEDKRHKRKVLDGDYEDLGFCDTSSSASQNCTMESAHNLQAFVYSLNPLCQTCHLVRLLDKTQIVGTRELITSRGETAVGTGTTLPQIAKLYSCLLTLFAVLNSAGGALPILNVLAFTKQLLPCLWNWIQDNCALSHVNQCTTSDACGNYQKEVLTGNSNNLLKEGNSSKLSGNVWTNAIMKLRPRSTTVNEVVANDTYGSGSVHDRYSIWSIESMVKGPDGLGNETVSVILLFCAAYAHLLQVMDDEEFYELQVPFTLEEQRLICAMLNTFVYHGFFSTSRHQFQSLMEVTCRCLRLLYARNCRRCFCPPELWLAPAVDAEAHVAAAARAHEVASAYLRSGGTLQGPAMGSILTAIPHVISFEERVHIFRELIRADKMARKMGGESVGPGPGSITVSIRRDHIVEDGLAQLTSLGSKLKCCINVSFVNEHGLPEAGIDYGGLFKEFLTDLAKAAFDPGYGLFMQTATEEALLFPHPAATAVGRGLETIQFLGRIVGKALYEGILLDYSFSPIFISKLVGHNSCFDELSELDRQLHQNLMYLKRYEGDVSDLCLDFTVTEELFGRHLVVELIPGGSKIAVTNENKLQYVHAMADYKLNRKAKPAISAFLKGLSDIILPSWLNLFNSREFNQLLSGGEHDFDVDDLREHTQYTGGFTSSSRTIKLFWEVVGSMEPSERCSLLKFVTSCSRAPLLGFKHLHPPFTIHKVASDTPVWAVIAGQDVDRLPTASTCYNILKLPTYRRSSTLRMKLQYAIRSNSGFELS